MTLDEESVHRICAAVDLGQSEPEINLSTVTFIKPFALVYLGMFLRHFNSRGKRFKLVVPRDPAVHGYLDRQNFWDRFNFTPPAGSAMLRRLSRTTSFNDVEDIERRHGIDEEIARESKWILFGSNVKGSDLSLIEEIVAELVSNFARHSRGPLAAMALQWYPRGNRICLAIGDCGIESERVLAAIPTTRT
jgi:hypothetical protein